MTSTNRRPINMTVWVCQWILAGAFEFIAMVKLGLPAELAQRFGLAAEASTAMLQTVALVEIGVSLLAILPAVTRVLPQLSTVAAAGLGGIALLRIAMPAGSASSGVLWLNLALAAFAAFVVWGRVAIVPIAPFADEDADPVATGWVRAPVARDLPRPPRVERDPVAISSILAAH
jgi:hypothetical protein